MLFLHGWFLGFWLYHEAAMCGPLLCLMSTVDCSKTHTESWFPFAKICLCPKHYSSVRPGVNSALCNYDWLFVKESRKALTPTLNATQWLFIWVHDASREHWVDSKIITASKQNLTVLTADSVGLFDSLGNNTSIVTPFDLEFGRMCYVISLSSFCLTPKEVDLLT